IEIINPLSRNFFNGPDYSDATIKLNGVVYYGNVEIHVKSSDWNLHGHQYDSSYNQVILHVVYIDDSSVIKISGCKLETLELINLLNHNYVSLFNFKSKYEEGISCGKNASLLFKNIQWLNKMGIERILHKSDEIKLMVCKEKNNINEVFYRSFVAAFGLPVNKDAFLEMALLIPFITASKYFDDPYALINLYMAASGLHSSSSEEGNNKLLNIKEKNYSYLLKKHHLNSKILSVLKTGGLRPINQPKNKILQLSFFLTEFYSIFNFVNSNDDLKILAKRFRVCFTSIKRNLIADFGLSLGIETENSIFTNLILPFNIFFRQINNEAIAHDSIISFFNSTLPEKNRIINVFKNNGFIAKNVLQSQGLIQIHRNLCSSKKCLDCVVGKQILKL
ncbi:MAG: DUF2851 family protein, partial [Bacteroidota bacterium]